MGFFYVGFLVIFVHFTAYYCVFCAYMCPVAWVKINKNVNHCSRLSTAHWPWLCNILWIPAKCTLQEHNRRQRHQANVFVVSGRHRLLHGCSLPGALPTHKRPCNLDLWPWYTIGFWSLSWYTFVQNFIKLSAAVHELSCWQSLTAENNTAVA